MKNILQHHLNVCDLCVYSFHMTQNHRDVPVINRDAMLRLLDRRQYSSFQTLYKELMDNPQIENINENSNSNEQPNEIDPNQNSSSQDSGNRDDIINSSQSGNDTQNFVSDGSNEGINQDFSSGDTTQDSGTVTGNEVLNESFEEIENPSQPHNLRHPRRSDQTPISNFENPSGELNLSNALREGQPVDADVSNNIGIFQMLFIRIYCFLGHIFKDILLFRTYFFGNIFL